MNLVNGNKTFIYKMMAANTRIAYNHLPEKNKTGGLCMRGSVYSEEKCFICGQSLTYDTRGRGLFCNSHPQVAATKGFYVKLGRNLKKRFKAFLDAERFLGGVRYETDKGTYDVRDYKKDNPLGFENLAQKWLKIKQKTVKKGSFKNLRRYMYVACKEWENRNIKFIQYGDIEDFLLAQPVADKTKHNMRSCLNNFFEWVSNREEHFQPPKLPDINFELGWRNIIDKEIQARIIDEVKRISYNYNTKIWIGIRWLSIYIRIRPGELLKLKESDIVNGFLIIPRPKEKKPKMVPLLAEDLEILQSIPRGLPHMHIFRHTKVKGHKPGSPFGDGMLLRWWHKACDNLGIKGADLYGGTRHSTVNYLKQFYTKEQIKNHGTGHETSKAFERYFGDEAKPSLDIFQKAADGLKKKEAGPHPDHVIKVDFNRKVRI